MQQTCCGLPVAMMAEKEAARDVARQNVMAMNLENIDHVVTLCASCASHLKHGYPRMLAEDPELGSRVTEFADKVVPFTVFMQDILKVSSDLFQASKQKVTYHAPCHLCRGLNVVRQPHELIRKSGGNFVPAEEEQTCCGFGGTYSSKFPEISARILNRKLDDVAQTGADILVTECPGCVMQLRGGAKRRQEAFDVIHLAELLARQKKS
jgi:Fe-S oxidoreductase